MINWYLTHSNPATHLTDLTQLGAELFVKEIKIKYQIILRQ